MTEQTFTFDGGDGLRIFVYVWYPEREVRGVIQVSHGMVETAERYRRFAEDVTREGFVVYANDHRGHGKTAQSVENVGDCGADGFDAMVKNMRQLNEDIRREYPMLPIFMFGHSMGSFLLQQYLIDYPDDELRGAILSGSNGKTPILQLAVGAAIAKRQMRKFGASAKSDTMNRLIFGRYGRRLGETRTPFDWLSRDESEVNRYIADPYCGVVCSTGFYYDFLQGLRQLHRQDRMARVRKDLPLYIFSGDEDPVGLYGKGVKNLVGLYRKAGLQDVVYRLYTGGRHEMLNETNRDDVIQDLLAWLNSRTVAMNTR